MNERFPFDPRSVVVVAGNARIPVRVTVMARCQAYVIQGPNPAMTASAVRCVRNSAGKLKVDGKSYPVARSTTTRLGSCSKKSGWLYAVDLDAKK